MAASFTLPTVLANLAAGNQALSLIDGDLTTLRDPLLSLNTFGNFYTDTGGVNAYVITVSAPQVVAQSAGLPIQFLAANANTGASTLQINALAVKSIVNIDGSALVPGAIPASGIVSVIYDGTSYQLQSKGKASALDGVTPLTGAAGTNTITATAAPTFAAYAAGQKFALIPAATNTGATTINIGGVGAKNIFFGNAACVGGELMINVPVLLMYDGTQFQCITPALRSKMITFVRAPATASGSVSYTGVGFRPTSLAGFAGQGTSTNMSVSGICDRSLAQGCIFDGTLFIPDTGALLSPGVNGSRQQFVVTSFDADGFTGTWTRIGAPGGADYSCAVIAYR